MSMLSQGSKDNTTLSHNPIMLGPLKAYTNRGRSALGLKRSRALSTIFLFYRRGMRKVEGGLLHVSKDCYNDFLHGNKCTQDFGLVKGCVQPFFFSFFSWHGE